MIPTSIHGGFLKTCVFQDEIVHGARVVDPMDKFENDIEFSVFSYLPLNSIESISSRNSASESVQSENSVNNCVDSRMVLVTGSTGRNLWTLRYHDTIFLTVSTNHRKISRLEERRSLRTRWMKVFCEYLILWRLDHR